MLRDIQLEQYICHNGMSQQGWNPTNTGTSDPILVNMNSPCKPTEPLPQCWTPHTAAPICWLRHNQEPKRRGQWAWGGGIFCKIADRGLHGDHRLRLVERFGTHPTFGDVHLWKIQKRHIYIYIFFNSVIGGHYPNQWFWTHNCLGVNQQSSTSLTIKISWFFILIICVIVAFVFRCLFAWFNWFHDFHVPMKRPPKMCVKINMR